MLHLPVGKDCLVNFLMYVCICLRSCKWVSTNLVHNYIALIFKWKWFRKFQQISYDARQFLKTVTILYEFSKTIGCWSQCLCKNHHFFAIQNCGKIIMLFDDQLHLGSVTVWILSIVWYMSEKLFSTSFLSFWPWKEKSKPRPFKSQALNRRNSFFSSLLLSKIAPLYYRFWLVRNRKKILPFFQAFVCNIN